MLLMVQAELAQTGGAALFLQLFAFQQLRQTADDGRQGGFGIVQQILGYGDVVVGRGGHLFGLTAFLLGAGDDGSQVVSQGTAAGFGLGFGGGQLFLGLIPIQLDDLQIQLGLVGLAGGDGGPLLGLLVGLLGRLTGAALLFDEGLGGGGGLHQDLLGVAQQVGAFGIDGLSDLGRVLHHAAGRASGFPGGFFFRDGGLHLLAVIRHQLVQLLGGMYGGLPLQQGVIIGRALELQLLPQGLQFVFDGAELLLLIGPGRVHQALAVLLGFPCLIFGRHAFGQQAIVISLSFLQLSFGVGPLFLQTGDVDVDGLDGGVDVLLAGGQLGGGGLPVQLLQTGALADAAAGGGQPAFHVAQLGLLRLPLTDQLPQPVSQTQ